MQVVINIDEEIYKQILPYKDLPVISNLANHYPELTHAVANGTPLPKEHGRLIDADKYRKDMQDSREFNFFVTLDFQPTIIEADRSEDE